jgi:hypothetical protein
MSTDDTRSVEALAREIQAYLDQHPAAADTLEGILAWWIARQRMAESADEVQQALDYLVSQQRIQAHHRQGGTVVYRRPDHTTKPRR